MPQATDQLRGAMFRRFGDHIGEAGPIAFLEERGYTLRRDFFWDAPDREPTVDENECILFLIQEWDFGGLARERR